MQVVARARAAGLTCRPRDIFVEQTVARLARVAGVADGAAGVVDEGIGPVVATPIMRWLHSVDGPVDQFNQTVVVQAPPASPRPTWWSCCRPCWTGMPCCGYASTTTAPADWSLTVPEAGSVDAGACLHTVDVLSDDGAGRQPGRG